MDVGATVSVALGQPTLPDVGGLDHVVVNADDHRDRGRLGRCHRPPPTYGARTQEPDGSSDDTRGHAVGSGPTRTMSLPVFSPVKSMLSARGAWARPSTMWSRQWMRPSPT